MNLYMSSLSSFNFRALVSFQPHWKHSNNFHYCVLSHPKKKCAGFSSFSHDEDSPSPTKQNQIGDDPSAELFGIEPDLQPRRVPSKLRSWFGPNGQYIREFPCPSCRGRGYTPCTECGLERSRQDCLLCQGKGITTCLQCFGDCVIWEESIDEKPWENAQSLSPIKVKEDDEVDKLDINLSAKRKTKRIYQSPSHEVNLKISRSLKSLNAKTGLFSKRMKIIHADPLRHAQRVAAIKRARRTTASRKRSSEAMKEYFRDPENRRKRSLIMKSMKFHCKNCGREGHRKHYCPDIEDLDRRCRCHLCGEKGHNRRTCPAIVLKRKAGRNRHCRICGQKGHNRRTCPSNTEATSPQNTPKTHVCRLCFSEGHNRRTCAQRSNYVHRKKVMKYNHCRICGQKGHNIRTCPQNNKGASTSNKSFVSL
ncbi:unnamed protein product [Cuscuta epithymum]|uniref:CCHC-type domain-containing protein n=1 Tax=Cuscuta epithymum TaxID=186058 RepID=A0AAV0D0I9_9ASTE|nr:unnamed protein product [Cuscuta epithymum]